MLVASGDSPLLTPELLRELVETHRRERPAVTVLSYEPPSRPPYGRIVRDTAGDLEAIVEARDATPEQLAIDEMAASLYVFSAADLWWALEHITADNDQGELYLTDTVGVLVADGRKAVVTGRTIRAPRTGSTRAPSSPPRRRPCATA